MSVAATRELFTRLLPGDKVELTHEVKVGQQVWSTKTAGEVVRTDAAATACTSAATATTKSIAT